MTTLGGMLTDLDAIEFDGRDRAHHIDIGGETCSVRGEGICLKHDG